MRIVMVNSTLNVGEGIDSWIVSFIRSARGIDRSLDFTVLCGESNYSGDIGADLVCIRSGRRAGNAALGMMGGLKSRVFALEPDIVHFHHLTLVLSLMGFKECPVINTYHSFYTRLFPRADLPLQIARRAFLESNKLFLRFVDKTVAISEYLRSELRPIVPPDKLTRIYNGIDVSRFRPSSRDDGYMLYVGRLTPHKNIPFLIEVSRKSGIPLVIVGDGPLASSLSRLAKGAQVTFKRKISEAELVKTYQRCSFYATASLWEGFSLTPVEAQSCGKPVVAFNVCAHPEVVLGGKSGFLVFGAEEFSEKCALLFSDKSLRTRMGRAGRSLAVSRFDWHERVKDYIALYRGLSA